MKNGAEEWKNSAKEWCQVNYFSWMDYRKVTRYQDEVKGTGKWQINYLHQTAQ